MADLIVDIQRRIRTAGDRYGNFASTHEALGVASEEWDELRDAIRANDIKGVVHECLDLAAVLLRLADNLSNIEKTRERSIK